MMPPFQAQERPDEWRAAVANGVALLDSVSPEPGWPDGDWRAAVRWDVLSMDDCRGCILAHLYGTFFEGVRRLFGAAWTFDDVRSHGFTGDVPAEMWRAAVE